ncbi:MAG TPA: hypothetical protein DDZ51_26025, partial [Planctomycetaceae bacterium]|nr:hypothetical protein [Planctomycetaceae bacterium]
NETFPAFFSIVATLILAWFVGEPTTWIDSEAGGPPKERGTVTIGDLVQNNAAEQVEENDDDSVVVHQAISLNLRQKRSSVPEQPPIPEADTVAESNAEDESTESDPSADSDRLATDQTEPSGDDEQGNADFQREHGVWQPAITLDYLPVTELQQRGDLVLIFRIRDGYGQVVTDSQGAQGLQRFVNSPQWSDVAFELNAVQRAELAVHLRPHKLTAENLDACYLVSRRLLAVIRRAQQAAAAQAGKRFDELLETSGAMVLAPNGIRYDVSGVSFKHPKTTAAMATAN